MAAAAAMFEIQINAIKSAFTTRFRLKIGTQTQKSMLSSNFTMPEV
jgi:hypothetical protein